HPRRLLWLPGLTLLWANLHGGYAMGIALTTVFLVGCLIERWLGSNELASRSAYLRYLILALVACFAIVPVNPIGFRMYKYPFETLGLTAIQKYIAEWASPNFHEVSYLPFMLLVLATLFAMGLAARRPRPRDMLLFLFALAAALVSVRHIPVFALVAVPVLAAAIPDGVWDFRENRLSSRKGLKLAFNGIVALAIVGFAAARLHSVARNEVKVERETFPVAAMDVIVSERLPTPILNHYNWGGYF